MTDNFFEYLKKRNKEKIDSKKKTIERYWKLSPIERIDYDNKLNKINQSYHLGVLSLFFWYLKIIFCIMLFFCVFNYFFNNILSVELIQSEQRIVGSLFSAIPIVCGSIILFKLFSWQIISRDIKELKKRFRI